MADGLPFIELYKKGTLKSISKGNFSDLSDYYPVPMIFLMFHAV